MLKSTSKADCQRHQFSLRPKGELILHAQNFHVSFCNQNQHKNNRKSFKHKSNCLNCPIFNDDKNFATPTFIISSQKNYYEKKGHKIKQAHQQKFNNFNDEKSSLNIPKPRSKSNYCSVCRQCYEDYLEHIQTSFHKKKISLSSFNKYILELTEKYPQIQDSPSSFLEKPMNEGSYFSSTGNEDSEVIEISNPQKRRKINQQISVKPAQNEKTTPVQNPFANNFKYNFPFYSLNQFQIPQLFSPFQFGPCGLNMNYEANSIFANYALISPWNIPQLNPFQNYLVADCFKSINNYPIEACTLKPVTIVIDD